MYTGNAGWRFTKSFFTKLYASAQLYRLSSHPPVLPIRIRLEVREATWERKGKSERGRGREKKREQLPRHGGPVLLRVHALGSELSTRPFAVLRCRKTVYAHITGEICGNLIRENVTSLNSEISFEAELSRCISFFSCVHPSILYVNVYPRLFTYPDKCVSLFILTIAALTNIFFSIHLH